MIATTTTTTNTQGNDADVLLDKTEAAKYLRICTRTLDYLREDGKITYCQIGGQIRFRLSDLREYVEHNAKKGTRTCQV